METEWRLRAVSVRTPVSRPARPTVSQWRGAAILFASGPSQVLADIWWASGDSCLDSTGPVRLLATVSSDRLRYTPVGDALALGSFRTRLETRTKESSMFASHWDSAKPKGVMKVKAVPSACLGRTRGTTILRRTPGASRAHCELRRTQSVHAGTRKMVNYAWSGRSQGKP